MADIPKKAFSSSVAGYSRSEVDAHVSSLMLELEKIETYNGMAMREQNALRERVTELQESLKLAKSPGYAQVGAQFEQTLRLAETEAARLINDASREAMKLRDQARADLENSRTQFEGEAATNLAQAEKEAKLQLSQAKKRSIEILEEAEVELNRATKERTSLEKQANVIRSEADNYAAQAKAELQAEVEKIQNANARLVKRNADLDAEITRKLDDGEKQALEIFRRVENEAQQMQELAERNLKDATNEASSLVENAEQRLQNARVEADRIFNDAKEMALNIMEDSRTRAERLAIKSLDLTRDAIVEAEYRLAKLPMQQAALEEFISETEGLLSPEQQVMLSRRQSMKRLAEAKAIEPEVIPSEG